MDLKESINNSGIKKTIKIENVPQLKQPVIDILNKQIANEQYSANIYFAMSACLDDKGWNNAGKLFLKYGHEEMSHMKKIQEYLYERNCRAVISPVNAVKTEYNDIREVLSTALEHEIGVTKNWTDIADLAQKNGDYSTMFLSEWFIREQREEENKFRDILDLLNLDIPNWELENVFKDML